MSHVTHANESHYPCRWVMSQIYMSHVTQMNDAFSKPVDGHEGVKESRHTCEWVSLHAYKSHVTNRNETCHTNEQHLLLADSTWKKRVAQDAVAHDSVMSRTRMGHDTRIKLTCHTYGWEGSCEGWGMQDEVLEHCLALELLKAQQWNLPKEHVFR